MLHTGPGMVLGYFIFSFKYLESLKLFFWPLANKGTVASIKYACTHIVHAYMYMCFCPETSRKQVDRHVKKFIWKFSIRQTDKMLN